MHRVHVGLHISKYICTNLYILEFFVALLLNPGMLVGFFSSEAHVSLSVQQLGNKVFCVIRYFFPNGGRQTVWALKYVLNNFFVWSSSKRWFPAQHNKKNDTHRPVIALCCIAAFQNFGCNVVRRSIGGIHDLIFANSFSQPKVNQLNIWIVVFLKQQEVLGFYIPNTNVLENVFWIEAVDGARLNYERTYLWQILLLCK